MKKPKLPKAFSRYGANMGRRDTIVDTQASVKFRLYQVHLDAGGYDNGGAYWGTGPKVLPLWHALATETEDELFFRAKDRAAARQKVLTTFPNAIFYR